MFTITVIHEMRWLPNDVEARLARLEDKIDALALSIKETNDTQIRTLADEVKTVREKLQTSINNQPKGE